VTGPVLSPAPPAPPAAAVVYGDALPVLESYAALLAGPGVERGLLGPREAPRLWERHLLNSVGLADLLAPGAAVVDLGSGAGLPGVVLAAVRPDLHVVLLEPLLRRAGFLEQVVAALDLPNAVVRRGRAEELGGGRLAGPGMPADGRVDAVVARAVAPLERLAGWALPLLRPGGRLLALKGASAEAELAAAAPALSAAGARSSRVVEVGDAAQLTAGRVIEVVAGAASAPSDASRRAPGRRR
jgi:16S rRNA (guanine527-N7)-methyltransferase